MPPKRHPTPITPVKASPGGSSNQKSYDDGPYICQRSDAELRAINNLVNYLKDGMTDVEDKKFGCVYVIKDKSTEMTKVGFTAQKELERLHQHITNCKIYPSKMYQHHDIQGAHKAEHIVHKLLETSSFKRLRCPCKRGEQKAGEHEAFHREWFSEPFLDVAMIVKLVCNWIEHRVPFHTTNGKEGSPAWGGLKEEWVESLDQWHRTQETEAPLEWTEFFLRHEKHWKDLDMPIPRTPKSVRRTPAGSNGTNNSGRNERPSGMLSFSPVVALDHMEVFQERNEVETSQLDDGTVVENVSNTKTHLTQDVVSIAVGIPTDTQYEAYAASPCPPAARAKKASVKKSVPAAKPKNQKSVSESERNSSNSENDSDVEEMTQSGSGSLINNDEANDSDYCPSTIDGSEYSSSSNSAHMAGHNDQDEREDLNAEIKDLVADARLSPSHRHRNDKPSSNESTSEQTSSADESFVAPPLQRRSTLVTIKDRTKQLLEPSSRAIKKLVRRPRKKRGKDQKHRKIQDEKEEEEPNEYPSDDGNGDDGPDELRGNGNRNGRKK